MNIFSKLLRWFFGPSYSLNVVHDQGAGSPIVLLHGIAANGHVWDPIIDELARSNRVVAFDLLGFGASVKPDIKYTTEDHAEAVLKTLSKLQIKSAVIVGHSMGGQIAVECALKRPDMFTQVICIGVPLYDMSGGKHRMLTTNRTNMYVRLYESMIARADTAYPALDKLLHRFGISMGLDLNHDSIPAFKRSLKNTVINQHTIESLLLVRVPTLILYGSVDPFILPEYYTEVRNQNSMISLKRVRGMHALTHDLYRPLIEHLESH